MGNRICSVLDCEKSVAARGWCSMHYYRWRTEGDPGEAESRAVKHVESCSILDCDRPAHVKGYCHRHYNNQRNYGYAVPVRDWPLIGKIVHTGWDENRRGCWEWRGDRNDYGYGRITSHEDGLSKVRVHRVMWEMHNGPIPDGLVVRHRCDNPPCVNPDHLELGTHADNSRDMAERNRSRAYATGRYDGVCVTGRHDVTEPGALKEVRQKGRKAYMTCVACDQERKRKYHENVTVPRREAKKKAAREAARKKEAA